MDLSEQTWLRDTGQGEMGKNALNPKPPYPNILTREFRGKREMGNQGESSIKGPKIQGSRLVLWPSFFPLLSYLVFVLFTVLVLLLISMINIISWNCRGAGACSFPRLIQEIKVNYNIQVLIITEPRVSGSRANSIIAKLGYDKNYRMEATGFSGGIWLL